MKYKAIKLRVTNVEIEAAVGFICRQVL